MATIKFIGNASLISATPDGGRTVKRIERGDVFAGISSASARRWERRGVAVITDISDDDASAHVPDLPGVPQLPDDAPFVADDAAKQLVKLLKYTKSKARSAPDHVCKALLALAPVAEYLDGPADAQLVIGAAIQEAVRDGAITTINMADLHDAVVMMIGDI